MEGRSKEGRGGSSQCTAHMDKMVKQHLTKKKKNGGGLAGELRALVAFPENVGSILSTYLSFSSLPGAVAPSSGFCGVETYMNAKHLMFT